MGKELGKAVRASGHSASTFPMNEREGGEVKASGLHAPFHRMGKAAGEAWSQDGHRKSSLAPRTGLPWYSVPYPVLREHGPCASEGMDFRAQMGFRMPWSPWSVILPEAEGLQSAHGQHEPPCPTST